jgi:hypothetical protein
MVVPIVSIDRTIPAPPRANDAARPSTDNVGSYVAEFLPSWLTSLVVHLSLVLLLAVLVVKNGSWSGNEISLDVTTTSGAEADGSGLLDAAIEMPSELLASELVTPTNEPTDATLTTDLVQPAEIKLAELPSSAALSKPILGDALDSSGSAGGAGTGQGKVRTEIFGLAGEGMRFVYVFDRSESMTSELVYTSEGTPIFTITPLEAAKAELLRSLRDLESRHEFGIIFYNHSPWQFTLARQSRPILAATPGNKRRASDFVMSMYGQGKTNHVKPLELALRLRPDIIFLLTDGEPKDDPTETELRELRALNDGHTRINVIQFCYKTQSGGRLLRLAEENGGKHVFFNISQLGPKMAGATRPLVP